MGLTQTDQTTQEANRHAGNRDAKAQDEQQRVARDISHYIADPRKRFSQKSTNLTKSSCEIHRIFHSFRH